MLSDVCRDLSPEQKKRSIANLPPLLDFFGCASRNAACTVCVYVRARLSMCGCVRKDQRLCESVCCVCVCLYVYVFAYVCVRVRVCDPPLALSVVFSYVYFYPSFLAGPHCEFTDYQRFVSGAVFYDDVRMTRACVVCCVLCLRQLWLRVQVCVSVGFECVLCVCLLCVCVLCVCTNNSLRTGVQRQMSLHAGADSEGARHRPHQYGTDRAWHTHTHYPTHAM